MNFAFQSTFRLKETRLLIWGSALSFVALFYNSGHIGINLSLFALLILFLQIRSKPLLISNNIYRILAGATLITALSNAWFGNTGNIWWLIICLLLTSATYHYPEDSLLLSETKITLGAVCSPFVSFAKQISKMDEEDGHLENNSFSRFILIYVLPSIVTLIFIWLYSSNNRIFGNWIREITIHIHLDILTTLFLGLIFSSICWQLFYPKELSNFDRSLKNHFNPGEQERYNELFASDSVHYKAGSVLFFMLNVSLIFYLVADLILIGHPEEGGNLSAQVHDNIGVIIFSVILATGLILFFFRKDFSSISKKRRLFVQAVGWIFLNLLLVFTTSLRNYHYVSELGLTVKRIGVYVYLLLTIIGLILALAKLYRRKTNAFLFRNFYLGIVIVLSINSVVDWGSIITKYNLNLAGEQKTTPDINYLLQFSPRSLPGILDYNSTHASGISERDSTLEDRIERSRKQALNYSPDIRAAVLSELWYKNELLER